MKTWIPVFAGMMLLVSHVYLGMGPIKSFSPTYDEPVHITAGYAALKNGNYAFNGYHHPPFGEMWAALPLVFSNLPLPVLDPVWTKQDWTPVNQYRFADKFLYRNTLSADKIMERARYMQLILSILFLGALAILATLAAGPWAGIGSLGLGCLSSTWLAHATLVSTDLSFAVFFFLFFGFLAYLQGRKRAIFSGLFLGLCVASKYSTLLIIPALGAVALWERKVKREQIILILVVAMAVLLTVYRVTGLEFFWNGITQFTSRSQAGRSSYFFGHHGTDGWFAYFPAAFFLKTEIPLLIALLISLVLIARKKVSLPSLIWIPPLVYFASACFSKVQIGHRHILPVYPFVFLISGVGLSALPMLWRRIIIPLLVIWMAAIAFLARPNFLSYFNEFIGGSKNGYQYFTDSNVDWGQGLKELRNDLNPTDVENGIYLSYFGVADPHFYGIKYIGIGSDTLPAHLDDGEDPSLKPTKFAISITNLQSTYFQDKTLFNWLKEYTPWKVSGGSIFVYDFSDKPEALQRIQSYVRPNGSQ